MSLCNLRISSFRSTCSQIYDTDFCQGREKSVDPVMRYWGIISEKWLIFQKKWLIDQNILRSWDMKPIFTKSKEFSISRDRRIFLTACGSIDAARKKSLFYSFF